MSARDEREQALEDHLTQRAVEEIADVNGPGEWTVSCPPGLVSSPREVYDVDQDVTEGPVVLTRRSDGARFLVDVSAAVSPA